ncbi:MAG: hypothetical protein R2795_11640 [Saprospiraceae bacterium]
MPLLQQFGVKPLHRLAAAEAFCDSTYLQQWLDARNWKEAWWEGNNLLYVGQLLVYLSEEQRIATADKALQQWFTWLDHEIDPTTGLWGTNGHCSVFDAMCGGYHQLLIYYYKQHPLPWHRQLVDATLPLQHLDGGFGPTGGGGACEDVDAVDILVNMYKYANYRRDDIRHVLRQQYYFLRGLQHEDGGFPYKKGQEQLHMGIPATKAGKDVSTTFPTWFRIHTLALLAEILTDEPELQKIDFHFSKAVSMGWHRSWHKPSLTNSDLAGERRFAPQHRLSQLKNWIKGYYQKVLFTWEWYRKKWKI